LKALRVGLGLREFHAITKQLGSETDKLDAARTEVSASQVQVAVWESEASQLDESLASADAELANANDALRHACQIATLVERQVHEATRAAETGDEVASNSRRLAELIELVVGLENRPKMLVPVLRLKERPKFARRVEELDAAAADIETESRRIAV
jgi:chromosome segregation ATPase